ncbi:MAG: hypothetical protein R3F56_17525 [Planctomycetota bacterium]
MFAALPRLAAIAAATLLLAAAGCFAPGSTTFDTAGTVLQTHRAVSLDGAFAASASAAARLSGEVRAEYSEGVGGQSAGAAATRELGRMHIATDTDFVYAPGSVALRGGLFSPTDEIGVEAIVGMGVSYLAWDAAAGSQSAFGRRLDVAPLLGAQVSWRALPGIEVEARGACTVGGGVGYEVRIGSRSNGGCRFAAGWRHQRLPDGMGLADSREGMFCEWEVAF